MVKLFIMKIMSTMIKWYSNIQEMSGSNKFNFIVCIYSSTDEDRVTPDPIDPDDIEVEINFEPDPTDLVLSSIPGGELFNPRKHRFSEEELKPQPMIKKAKKVFVPEEKKVNTLKLYVKLKCKHCPKYYLNIA